MMIILTIEGYDWFLFDLSFMICWFCSFGFFVLVFVMGFAQLFHVFIVLVLVMGCAQLFYGYIVLVLVMDCADILM